MIDNFGVKLKGVICKKLLEFRISLSSSSLLDNSPKSNVFYSKLRVILICCSFIFISMSLSTQLNAQCNFVTNGSFDSDLSGWTASGI